MVRENRFDVQGYEIENMLLVPADDAWETLGIANGTDAHFDKLLDESWEAFDRLSDQDFLVRPAMPILYFGDCNQYFASPLRVITV